MECHNLQTCCSTTATLGQSLDVDGCRAIDLRTYNMKPDEGPQVVESSVPSTSPTTDLNNPQILPSLNFHLREWTGAAAPSTCAVASCHPMRV